MLSKVFDHFKQPLLVVLYIMFAFTFGNLRSTQVKFKFKYSGLSLKSTQVKFKFKYSCTNVPPTPPTLDLVSAATDKDFLGF